MSNISFDNPLLLLLFLPLLAVICLPFFFSVVKGTRNFHNVLSLICHILIAALLSLTVAGMKYDAMITETNVYVLADVSHSSQNNLDVVDGYIHSIEKNLPKNTKISVIAFGRNYQMLSDLGEPTVSVHNADRVDTSATDIASALRYAGNLFEGNVIKRIIVITDGVETAGRNDVTGVVASLEEDGICVDAVYLNNALSDDTAELQISDVTYTENVFCNRRETALLTVLSNNDRPTRVYFDVECNKEVSSVAKTLYKGENEVEVSLNTEKAGSFTYTVTLRPEQSSDDTSLFNNACMFTQNVTDSSRVLFIGGSSADVYGGRAIYGTENVDYITDPSEIPVTVEELCTYDEIVLSNFDVRTMLSSRGFMRSLDVVVSKFGKTLTTYGNTFIQETVTEPNRSLQDLSGMLPVTMGNPDQDSRLIALVLDISTSMDFADRLTVARRAAVTLLETFHPNDLVMVIGFSGDIKIMRPATYLEDKEEIIKAISTCEVRNGTYLKDAVDYAYQKITETGFRNREMIIVSDCLLYMDEERECLPLAETISENHVTLSAVGIIPTGGRDDSFLQDMVNNKNANGKGYYKVIKNENEIDFTLQDLTEEMTDVRIEGGDYAVSIRLPMDGAVQGLTSLPSANGFWYNRAKSGAVTVLSAKYYRDKVTGFDVPLYAYWSYGNGRVASFTSDFTNDWICNWIDQGGETFFANVALQMLPDEHITTPFLIQTETNASRTEVRVTASEFRNGATLYMTMKDPDGMEKTLPMFFDSEQYVCTFDTPSVGTYALHFVYEYEKLHYEGDHTFSIFYLPEYNSFTPYSVAALYRIVTGNGEVSTDGTLKLDNSLFAMQSYGFSFTVPLMAACVILFVLDVIIRMLRWKDIRSLFSRRGKKQLKEAGKGGSAS